MLEFSLQALFRAQKKDWSSLFKICSSEPELIPYLVTIRLQAQAFEPKPRLFQDQGLLSPACTYVGAGKIKEMPKRTTFVRVTQQINEVYGAHGGGSDRT